MLYLSGVCLGSAGLDATIVVVDVWKYGRLHCDDEDIPLRQDWQ